MLGRHVRVASPRGLRAAAGDARASVAASRASAARLTVTERSDRRRRAAPMRSTPTSGRRWARRRRRTNAATIFAPLPGQRRADGARRAGRDLHALPARPPRRRGHRRSHGLARVGRLRPGREPAAHAEGAARDARVPTSAGDSYNTAHMRQAVITRHGLPDVFQMREGPDPLPAPGEVRIRVRAAGINFADILARLGLYPDAPKPPLVVGYEVAGTIDAIGCGRHRLQPGDRVVALTRFGGYADVVVVHGRPLFPRSRRA